MRLTDLHDPARVFDATLGRRLGGGAQAEVFSVRISGRSIDTRRPWVLKRYHSPASREHLLGFTRYVQRYPDLHDREHLSLPEIVVEDEGGHLGCLMPRLEGEPLDAGDRVYDAIHRLGLAGRLRLAAGLAGLCARLHRHGVVAADLSEPNVLVDVQDQEVRLLDLEGGGVLSSALGPDYRPELAPLVRGRFERSFLAPELVLDEDCLPSLESDRWSLTVLLHYLLFAGLDPYFTEPTFTEIAANPVHWPPSGNADPALPGWSAFHDSERRRLGALLTRRFRAAFDGPSRHGWTPRTRPSAAAWSRDLSIAAHWVLTCATCGEEFVGLRVGHCPFCRSAIQHPTLWTDHTGLTLDQEGVRLTSRDLGFSEQGEHHELARFGRQEGALILSPLTRMRDLTHGQDVGPGDPPLMLHAGQFQFEVASRDPGCTARFRINSGRSTA